MVEFRLNTAENELCEVEIPMSEWRSGATVGRGRSRRPRGRRQSDRAPTVRPATPNPKKPSRSDTRDKFQAGQHFSELAAVRSEPPFTSSRPPARGGLASSPPTAAFETGRRAACTDLHGWLHGLGFRFLFCRFFSFHSRWRLCSVPMRRSRFRNFLLFTWA